MSPSPAIALLEFDSVAVGTIVADAMVKRAPIATFRVGTVQPGKYLILVGGTVAVVEEAHSEGLRLSEDALTDEILLPYVHEEVYNAVEGKRLANKGDALGIIETSAIPSNVKAADAARKSVDVTIVELRLGDGLGGKGLTHFSGRLAEVEAAIDAGLRSISNGRVKTRTVIIPAQHADVRETVGRRTSFFE